MVGDSIAFRNSGSHRRLEMEPLSVGIHAVANIADFRANQSVVIFGAGPVGLLCMAVAKALGASRVIAVDIVPSRLDFAKDYAATDTYLPPKLEPGEAQTAYSERNAKLLREQLGIEDRGPMAIDLVVDASGAPVSIQTGVHIVRPGGTFVQVRPVARTPYLFIEVVYCRLEWAIQTSRFRLLS